MRAKANQNMPFRMDYELLTNTSHYRKYASHWKNCIWNANWQFGRQINGKCILASQPDIIFIIFQAIRLLLSACCLSPFDHIHQWIYIFFGQNRITLDRIWILNIIMKMHVFHLVKLHVCNVKWFALHINHIVLFLQQNPNEWNICP